VLYREAESERTRSLPAGWTDVVGVDPYVVLAAGRSYFWVEELLALVSLMRQLEDGGVSEILP
jgi:hypothetical protein